MKLNEFDEARLKANRELLLLLACIVERYPGLRFNQILNVYGFCTKGTLSNGFNEEPQVTLKRVETELKALGINIHET